MLVVSESSMREIAILSDGNRKYTVNYNPRRKKVAVMNPYGKEVG
jgi:hypothetical protein